MKTKIISLLAVTITAALISQPMFAVPTTYVYTGNPFTTAQAPYSTSDFVTVRVTLARPLGANMPITVVTPLAFSFSDGVQTITKNTATITAFYFATGPLAQPTTWDVAALIGPAFPEIITYGSYDDPTISIDTARITFTGFASILGAPGSWGVLPPPTPDPGSSLALLSLSLTALGVVARQFKRAAA